jgi:hypothetical protein
MFKSSILNVDRNFSNNKLVKQDCFVVKTIKVERILFNQKLKRDSVTISCQQLSQMIKKRV